MLRFSNAIPEHEIVVITRKEQTKRMRIPRHRTLSMPSPLSTEWAEKSLKNFENVHKLSRNSSQGELVNTFKASMKDKYPKVSHCIDVNVQRLSLTHSRANSRPLTPYVEEPLPPLQTLVEYDTELIDKYYPNPSHSRAHNRIVLPGDFEYDAKRSEQLAKSQHAMSQLKGSDKSTPVVNKESEDDAKDEEFILNLLKTQYEAKYLPKPKDNLLAGLNFFWSQRDVSSTRPEAREGGSLVCISQRFFLFAGQGTEKRNDVRVLNPDTWLWTPMKAAYAPKGRIGHTACGYKNKMIVFGGWAHYSQRMGIRRCFRKVYILRLKQGSWYSRVGSGEVPKARRCHMAASLGRSMIIFGGLDSLSKRLRNTYIYDIKDQSWQKVPTTLLPGGRSNGTLTRVFHSSLMNRSDFSVLSPPRLKSEFVLPGSGFYLFGGLNDEDIPTNELLVLEMKNGSLVWSEVRQGGSAPLARYDHCAELVQNCIIICGGRNDSLFKRYGDSCLNDVHVFKVESLAWEEVKVHGSIPAGRWGHCCAAYGSKLLMLGGINHRSYLSSDVYVLETDRAYVTELVRQLADQQRRRDAENTALKRTSALLSAKYRGSPS
jgi:N-acetylneuraminic acid mutarotase